MYQARDEEGWGRAHKPKAPELKARRPSGAEAADQPGTGELFMNVFLVSGLPRSGTSLMMQMLRAGGLEILVDDHRPPYVYNPRGYFAYAPAMALKWENLWLPEAVGKAVKVIPPLLPYLPNHFKYKLIFMERNLDEVMVSQGALVQRLGSQDGNGWHATLKSIFTRQLRDTERWLAAQPHLEVLAVDYRQAVSDPETTARTVADFLGCPLNVQEMTAVIDPFLYR